MIQTLNLQQKIDDALANHESQLTIPPGVYRITTDHIAIQKANGFTLEAQGVTLLLSSFKVSGFGIANSNNVTVKGLTLDYDPLPFTQGTITAKAPDGSWYDFQIDSGYPELSAKYNVTHPLIFDADLAHWKSNIPDLYCKSVQINSPTSGHMVMQPRSTLPNAVDVGDKVVLNNRESNAIKIQTSQNVRLEDVTVLSAPGGAIMARYVKGDNYFRCTVKRGPRPEGASVTRLISTCADAFNYAFARQGPTLEKCEFCYQGDDAVNLHGLTVPIVRVESPTSFITVRSGIPEPFDYVFAAGDQARILAPNTYQIRSKVPVQSVEKVDNGPELSAEALKKLFPSHTPNRLTYYRVTLQQPADMNEQEWVDFPNTESPHFTIRDCYFHDNRARGIRLQASHGIIENCKFERIRDAAITIGPEYAFWHEGGWVQDVTITKNVIRDVGQGADISSNRSFVLGAINVGMQKDDPKDASPYAEDNQNIRIVDNTIDGSSVSGVFVNAARNVEVHNNTISRVDLRASSNAGANHHLRIKGPVTVAQAADVKEH